MTVNSLWTLLQPLLQRVHGGAQLEENLKDTLLIVDLSRWIVEASFMYRDRYANHYRSTSIADKTPSRVDLLEEENKDGPGPDTEDDFVVKIVFRKLCRLLLLGVRSIVGVLDSKFLPLDKLNSKYRGIADHKTGSSKAPVLSTTQRFSDALYERIRRVFSAFEGCALVEASGEAEELCGAIQVKLEEASVISSGGKNITGSFSLVDSCDGDALLYGASRLIKKLQPFNLPRDTAGQLLVRESCSPIDSTPMAPRTNVSNNYVENKTQILERYHSPEEDAAGNERNSTSSTSPLTSTGRLLLTLNRKREDRKAEFEKLIGVPPAESAGSTRRGLDTSPSKGVVIEDLEARFMTPHRGRPRENAVANIEHTTRCVKPGDREGLAGGENPGSASSREQEQEPNEQPRRVLQEKEINDFGLESLTRHELAFIAALSGSDFCTAGALGKGPKRAWADLLRLRHNVSAEDAKKRQKELKMDVQSARKARRNGEREQVDEFPSAGKYTETEGRGCEKVVDKCFKPAAKRRSKSATAVGGSSKQQKDSMSRWLYIPEARRMPASRSSRGKVQAAAYKEEEEIDARRSVSVSSDEGGEGDYTSMTGAGTLDEHGRAVENSTKLVDVAEALRRTPEAIAYFHTEYLPKHPQILRRHLELVEKENATRTALVAVYDRFTRGVDVVNAQTVEDVVEQDRGGRLRCLQINLDVLLEEVPQPKEKTINALKPVMLELYFRRKIDHDLRGDADENSSNIISLARNTTSFDRSGQREVHDHRTRTTMSFEDEGILCSDRVAFGPSWDGLSGPLTLKKKQENGEHWRCLVLCGRNATSGTDKEPEEDAFDSDGDEWRKANVPRKRKSRLYLPPTTSSSSSATGTSSSSKTTTKDVNKVTLSAGASPAAPAAVEQAQWIPIRRSLLLQFDPSLASTLATLHLPKSARMKTPHSSARSVGQSSKSVRNKTPKTSGSRRKTAANRDDAASCSPLKFRKLDEFMTPGRGRVGIATVNEGVGSGMINKDVELIQHQGKFDATSAKRRLVLEERQLDKTTLGARARAPSKQQAPEDLTTSGREALGKSIGRAKTPTPSKQQALEHLTLHEDLSRVFDEEVDLLGEKSIEESRRVEAVKEDSSSTVGVRSAQTKDNVIVLDDSSSEDRI
ncbi:unnamed protein product [Amoebophrya sp. A25]|nr:unnamed protein product [Amoebophrya sp. A25]|eukprot:GSA25T00004232001.1